MPEENGELTPHEKEIVESHPDDAPPSAELKDIAIKSAAKASQTAHLEGTVKVLTTEVIGLRTEVSKAVSQDELRVSQRHQQRVLLWPLIIGAIGLIVIAGGIIGLLSIANGNRRNGELIINCTTAPANDTPAEHRKHACYELGQKNQAVAVRHLECTNLLINGVNAPGCDDVREQLTKAGVLDASGLPVKAQPTPPAGR